MHNVEGMKKGRLCKTAFATICESKEGSKSATDSEKAGICSELKSSISSISSAEDIEEMAKCENDIWDTKQCGNNTSRLHDLAAYIYSFGKVIHFGRCHKEHYHHQR
jgi:hypothetical protein